MLWLRGHWWEALIPFPHFLYDHAWFYFSEASSICILKDNWWELLMAPFWAANGPLTFWLRRLRTIRISWSRITNTPSKKHGKSSYTLHLAELTMVFFFFLALQKPIGGKQKTVLRGKGQPWQWTLPLMSSLFHMAESMQSLILGMRNKISAPTLCTQTERHTNTHPKTDQLFAERNILNILATRN